MGHICLTPQILFHVETLFENIYESQVSEEK